MGRNEEKINQTIDAFINQQKIRKNYYEISVRKAWKDLMGEMVDDYTTSIKISKEKLILEFSSAPLKHEISFQKEQLIRLLNDRLGKELIKEVIIR
ncbi:MAG TPA: DUF721 domain-containing protein [Saprospiraceae bacterium]|nr:DUF721 domain-containing protein [Saprospiraceae bacterium]